MKNRIVVLTGVYQVDLPQLRETAWEFGWLVDSAKDLRQIEELETDGKLLSIVFPNDALGEERPWIETVRILRKVAQCAHLVACNEFSDPVDLPKLARAGLFHSLWLPLSQSEVRQCFGFLWEAERRAARKTSLRLVDARAARAS